MLLYTSVFFSDRKMLFWMFNFEPFESWELLKQQQYMSKNVQMVIQGAFLFKSSQILFKYTKYLKKYTLNHTCCMLSFYMQRVISWGKVKRNINFSVRTSTCKTRHWKQPLDAQSLLQKIYSILRTQNGRNVWWTQFFEKFRNSKIQCHSITEHPSSWWNCKDRL